MAFIPQNFKPLVAQPPVTAVWLNGIDVTVNGVMAGATTVPQALAALGLGGVAAITGLPVPINQGGTNAITAGAALANLGGTTLGAVNQSYIGGQVYPPLPSEAGLVVNVWIPYFNVLRYGADPTGVALSNVAFASASAVALANFNGGVVYAPAGNYRVSATTSGALVNSLHIVGDGMSVTTITQTADADVFAYTIAAGSTGRLVVDGILFVAATGSAMTTGAPIRVTGPGTGPNGPVRSLVVRNCLVLGSTPNDGFKYCLWTNAINSGYLSNLVIGSGGGALPVASTIGIHIEATTTPAIAWDIMNVQVYNALYGLEIFGNVAPGVEGVRMTQCDFVGVSTGVKAVNALNLTTQYAPPQITMLGCHINSTHSCVDITNYVQVSIDDCLFYCSSSTAGDAVVKFSGVQTYSLNFQSTMIGTGDVPVLALDGTQSACGNGVLDGFFSGKPGTVNRVVTAKGTIFQARVKGTMFAYAGWVPPVSNPGYSGLIFCNPNDVVPLTADEISVDITPSGGVMNLSFVQSPYVVLKASSGTITSILPCYIGQRVTIECDAAGVILQHNTFQLMPGQIDYPFTVGSTIDLYRVNPTFWRTVGRQ